MSECDHRWQRGPLGYEYRKIVDASAGGDAISSGRVVHQVCKFCADERWAFVTEPDKATGFISALALGP